MIPLPYAQLIVPGDVSQSLLYAVDHFILTCRQAIADHDFFAVALSGGSTPKAIYELLCSPPYCEEIEWEKVHLFWSDERSVPPEHPDNNYRMAMEAGFAKVPLIPTHIHRMVAEDHIEENALKYEKEILRVLQDRSFDLIMLGMGSDGHTASLFPGTQALHAKGKLATANFIPQLKTFRMTLTFECLNAASCTVFYVFGASKKEKAFEALHTKPHLPCQYVGTEGRPALWILDQEAAP